MSRLLLTLLCVFSMNAFAESGDVAVVMHYIKKLNGGCEVVCGIDIGQTTEGSVFVHYLPEQKDGDHFVQREQIAFEVLHANKNTTWLAVATESKVGLLYAEITEEHGATQLHFDRDAQIGLWREEYWEKRLRTLMGYVYPHAVKAMDTDAPEDNTGRTSAGLSTTMLATQSRIDIVSGKYCFGVGTTMTGIELTMSIRLIPQQKVRVAQAP